MVKRSTLVKLAMAVAALSVPGDLLVFRRVRWQAAERPDGLAPATSTRVPAGAASTGALLADTGQP
jgi:hypothetical protein